MSGDENPSTEELRIVQRDREVAETAAAEDADLPAEEHTHERRADRAAYLQEKLSEQAAADAEREDDQ